MEINERKENRCISACDKKCAKKIVADKREEEFLEGKIMEMEGKVVLSRFFLFFIFFFPLMHLDAPLFCLSVGFSFVTLFLLASAIIVTV